MKKENKKTIVVSKQGNNILYYCTDYEIKGNKHKNTATANSPLLFPSQHLTLPSMKTTSFVVLPMVMAAQVTSLKTTVATLEKMIKTTTERVASIENLFVSLWRSFINCAKAREKNNTIAGPQSSAAVIAYALMLGPKHVWEQRELIEENCETRADQEDPVETETENWFRIGSKCLKNIQNEVYARKTR